MADDGDPAAVVRSLPLHPLARIIARLLVGALGDGEALKADIEPRIVQHGEHAVQAAVLLADQIPHGAVIVAERHAAGRAGVAAAQIGRASCRASVWTYVYNSVVVGTLKKKKTPPDKTTKV